LRGVRVVGIAVLGSISWQVARDSNARGWQSTIRVSRDNDINALSVEFNLRANVKSVPLPSQNAVITRWQVRWQLNVNWLLVLILARWKIDNLKPLLLGICLVNVVGNVNSAVTNVSSGQFPLHCNVSSGLDTNPLILGWSWVIAAYKFRASWVADRSILLVVVLSSVFTSWHGLDKSAMSKNAW